MIPTLKKKRRVILKAMLFQSRNRETYDSNDAFGFAPDYELYRFNLVIEKLMIPTQFEVIVNIGNLGVSIS